MAGGTKRLPRAVREQQMLDAAVQMFSVNGYHETSMDVIAAKAEISKPMLYLYYGSKEELFGACLDRELTRFIDGVREEINLEQSPKDLLRNTIVAFMRYIDANRASWIVMYTPATHPHPLIRRHSPTPCARDANGSSPWSPDCCKRAPEIPNPTPTSR
jgi:AcrR family transcriptional regulator